MFSRLVRLASALAASSVHLFFANRFSLEVRVVPQPRGRIGNRLRRILEAQIALTIGLIAGLIFGWLTAGMYEWAAGWLAGASASPATNRPTAATRSCVALVKMSRGCRWLLFAPPPEKVAVRETYFLPSSPVCPYLPA